VLGTTMPSLLGNQRASFSVELTSEGSTLMRSALQTGAAPVLIVYDLEYNGLVPARGLRAKLEYKSAYQYLRNRFAENSLYFRADLDREIEQLQKQGLISIEDVDFQGVDAATRAARAEEIRATLAKLMQGMFFRPAAEPSAVAASGVSITPAADASWASQGRPQLAFLLRDFDQQEQDTITYDLTQTRVESRRAAPQGAVRLPAGTDPSKVIAQATLEWPPPVTAVRAFTLPDADWAGVKAIEVNVRQGEDIRTIVLTPAIRDQSVHVAAGPIEYSVSVKTAPEPDALGAPPQRDVPFQPLTTSNLFLDPAAMSGRRDLHLVLGAVDALVVSRTVVTLTAGEFQRQFQLIATQPEVVVPVWGAQALRLHAEFVIGGGQTIAIERDVAANDTVVVLNQPANQFHLVTVMLQDPLNRYGSVSVTLEAADEAPRRNVVLDSANPAAQWSAPRDPASPGSFRYRVKKVLRNASVVDSDWAETTGSLLVVGDLDVRIDTIQGFLLLAGDTLGALIHFEPIGAPPDIDAAQDLVLDPGQTAFTANLAFAKAAPRQYTVSGQIFQASGNIDLPAWKDSAEVLLITPKLTASAPGH